MQYWLNHMGTHRYSNCSAQLSHWNSSCSSSGGGDGGGGGGSGGVGDGGGGDGGGGGGVGGGGGGGGDDDFDSVLYQFGKFEFWNRHYVDYIVDIAFWINQKLFN